MIKKLLLFSPLLFLLCLMMACGRNGKGDGIVEIFPSSEYQDFSSKAFVSDNIKSIIFYQDNFFFLDKKASVVIRTDENMNFISSYGQIGRGPGETIFLESFGVGDNKIYLSGTGCCFNVFDITTGEHEKKIQYEESIGTNPITQRMIIEDQNIIGSYNGKYTMAGNPIVKINQDGDVLIIANGSVSGDNDKIKAMTDRDIFRTDEGKYISLVKNIPAIDVYNKELQYEKTIDISGIDIIKSRIDQIEDLKKKDKNPNTIHYLFKDSYYSNDKLYVLCLVDNDGSINTPVACNIILEFKVSGNNVEYIDTQKLPDVWYNSICIATDNNLLVAANTFKSTIEVFDLK